MKKLLSQAMFCFVCLWPSIMVQADDDSTATGAEQQQAEQDVPVAKAPLTADVIDRMITVERAKYWAAWRRLQREKMKAARVRKQLPELKVEYNSSVRQLTTCLAELDLPYEQFIIAHGSYSRVEFESAVETEVDRVIGLKAELELIESNSASYEVAIRRHTSDLQKAGRRLAELIREVRFRLLERDLAQLGLELSEITSELVGDSHSPLVEVVDTLQSERDEAMEKAGNSPRVAFPLDQVGRSRDGNFTQNQNDRLIAAGVQVQVIPVDNTPAGE